MNIYSSQEITIRRFRQTPGQRRCPECGGRMVEADRCNENGVMFVWHECSGDSCNGQWLQKIPQKFQAGPVLGVPQ